MKYPLVYISILNWNGYQDTEACLSSLFDSDYPNYRAVVIDNGSTDGSVEHLQRYGDRIILLCNEINLGYTGGNNLAIKRALADAADYIWLLNNDVTVRADTLRRLVDTASADPRVGLLSPVIYFADSPDRIWNCGATLFLDECKSEPIGDIAVAREWQQAQPKKVALYGTALLIRRALVETIGLLDDQFFAYHEDIDYCIRSVKAGYMNVIVFESTVYHKKSVDLHFELPKAYFYYLITRNRFLLWSKHADHWRGLKGKLWYSRTVLDWVARYESNPVAKAATLDALWDIWCGVTGGYSPKRRMPWPLRTIFGLNPRFWRGLLDAI